MMTDKYNYYGVFLLSYEATRLLRLSMPYIEDKKIDIEDWRLVCDHCTILHYTHKNQDMRKYLDLARENTIEFNVNGIGFSDKAIAVRTDLPSENRVSHITIAVAPGGMPSDSNFIPKENWIDIPKTKFTGMLLRV